MNLIDNIKSYINILNQSDISAFLYKLEIKNIADLYSNNIKRIQIYINSICYETIYLDNLSITNKIVDLYLCDGENKIDIILINAYDDKQIYTENIKVDLNPIIPDDEVLLTNFIGNDDQMIQLLVGSSDL